MKKLSGNLLDLAEAGHFDVIVHGCNCFHAMRRGIAQEISLRYPEARQADLSTTYGDRQKLSRYSKAVIKMDSGTEFTIINAYTQYRWSSIGDVFEYESFETFLNRLAGFASQLSSESNSKIRIGFPKIGCGLAGGEPNRIIPMIEKFSKDVDNSAEVTLVEKD